MGGMVAVLRGRADSRLLEPRPAKRGLIDRLLGRHPVEGPREIKLGDGSSMIELPSDSLNHLPKEFQLYLRRSMPEPWQSTKSFLDYLSIDILSVQLRGERKSNDREMSWYLQFSFSGCAGMAETSAELGSHWVEKWIQKEGPIIQDTLLTPNGFNRDLSQTGSWQVVFVPFEGLGYGRRVVDSTTVDPEWEGSKLFEFDYAQIEAFQVNGELGKLRSLDERFVDLGSNGSCLCQLCSPSFKPPQFVA